MKLFAGGLIVVILLGLYVYAVHTGLLVVSCASTPGCTAHPLSAFTTGFALVLSTVGGLVSALVITELAITKPGELPTGRILAAPPAGAAASVLKALTVLYLLVWLGYGLAAFVVGTMRHPSVLQPLTDLGQAWLGLAVASAYSYLGIKQ